jgi:SAM-dependent methyltransferase
MNSEDNRLSTDSAVEFYRGESGRDYHEGKRALRAEALPWLMALRAEKFQRHVRVEDVVFEFGAGAGWNLGRLRCARRIACDVSDFLAGQLAAVGIEFVGVASAVPDASADVIICHHALEHLTNPANALRQFARILKPEGTLIVHVPWERERRYARYHADEPNHHLYTWNAQNVGNLASVLGYQVKELSVRRYGYDRFAANLAVRLRLGQVGFRLIRTGMIALRPLREVELVATPKIMSRLKK